MENTKNMKIWLCLLTHENENGTLQNVHFPLSIGFIATYLINYTQFEIDIKLFKRPSDLSNTLNRELPNIIMFGNYMWNENLNLFFAKKIKNFRNDILVIFGGPNFSLQKEKNINFLIRNQFIDLVIEGDAEIASRNIVEKFFQLRNIQLIKNLKIANTLSVDHINSVPLISEAADDRLGIGDQNLDIIPSPYLAGLFDKFFEDGAIVLLESNRGCPYHCTYCQQATKYFKKIRYFSSDRIKEELRYISKKIQKNGLQMTIAEFTDPNFGMYKEDHPVFLAIKENQNEFDFPGQVWCSTGKSQPQRIIDHAKLLKKDSIMIRAAVQSMNSATLEAVKRKNLPVPVLKQFSEDEVETYSDVMLCLPNETLESYLIGIYELIDQGINEFSMPTTLLLKGTPLELDEETLSWGLKSKFRVIPECSNYYTLFNETERVTEFESVICQTNSLSFDDYLEARIFNLFIMIYHNTRMLNLVYKYLDEKKIERSMIIKTIMQTKNEFPELINLLKRFVEDVKAELLDSVTTMHSESDIENLTANKIFKYLSLSLTFYKDTLIALIERAISCCGVSFTDVEKEFFVRAISLSFLDFKSNSDLAVSLKVPSSLTDILKSEFIEITYTEFQLNRLKELNHRYNSKEKEDINIAYHLRPANMIKTIRFI